MKIMVYTLLVTLGACAGNTSTNRMTADGGQDAQPPGDAAVDAGAPPTWNPLTADMLKAGTEQWMVQGGSTYDVYTQREVWAELPLAAVPAGALVEVRHCVVQTMQPCGGAAGCTTDGSVYPLDSTYTQCTAGTGGSRTPTAFLLPNPYAYQLQIDTYSSGGALLGTVLSPATLPTIDVSEWSWRVVY